MKKTIYLLNVNNYAPEITEITYPLIEQWAKKIGADLFKITERKYPEFPPVYEKLQIYDLAKERGDDWIIYIDSDALVHPDMFDPTEHLPIDTVMNNNKDFANNRWKYDDYFRRDGRNIGVGNWFTVASKLCLDLWQPLDDLTFEQAVENIYPTQVELNTVIKREHLIDDYVLSRNIARFGLKYKTFTELLKEKGIENDIYLAHLYQVTTAEKVALLSEQKTKWLNHGKK